MQTFVDSHHGTDAGPGDESDVDTESSSDDGHEIEPIEIQKRYFPLNPYKHYIDTGDIAHIHTCGRHFIPNVRTQLLWSFGRRNQ